MDKLTRLSKCYLDEQEQEAVARVLSSGYLGMGAEVEKFENELANFLKTTSVACVSSGTAALHLALQAIGIKSHEEVIVPSITYVACFQAISATGATPVACDIDLKNGGLCLDDLKKKINKNTKAIMYVHYASFFSKRNEIVDLLQKSDIRLIEDAAHSFGCYYPNGKLLGDNFDIVCFSFDGIKNITTGEGGAIISEDPLILEHVKNARLLGVKNDSKARFKKERTWDLDVDIQGWRYHMSDINAAIGREQLKKIELFRQLRNKVVQFYLSELSTDTFKFLDVDYNSTTIPHIFPIIFDSPKLRDDMKEFLNNKNIQTGIHWKPNHLLTKYYSPGCKNAEFFYDRVLSLPIHCSLKESELRTIVEHINNFTRDYNGNTILSS